MFINKNHCLVKSQANYLMVKCKNFKCFEEATLLHHINTWQKLAIHLQGGKRRGRGKGALTPWPTIQDTYRKVPLGRCKVYFTLDNHIYMNAGFFAGTAISIPS